MNDGRLRVVKSDGLTVLTNADTDEYVVTIAHGEDLEKPIYMRLMVHGRHGMERAVAVARDLERAFACKPSGR